MAKMLYEQIKDIPNLEVTQKVESNAVFAIIPKKYLDKIHKEYFFHVFDEQKYEVRLMCSYNTTRKDILDFARNIKENMK